PEGRDAEGRRRGRSVQADGGRLYRKSVRRRTRQAGSRMSGLVQPIVSRPDAVGRAIMAVCAIAAAYAALSTLTPVAPDLVWLSTWQMLGFALFAGMFALLAIRPRLSAGVWELCFLNKAGL